MYPKFLDCPLSRTIKKKKGPRDRLTRSVAFQRNSQICETDPGPPVGQWWALIMSSTKNGMIEQKIGKDHPPLTKNIRAELVAASSSSSSWPLWLQSVMKQLFYAPVSRLFTCKGSCSLTESTDFTRRKARLGKLRSELTCLPVPSFCR